MGATVFWAMPFFMSVLMAFETTTWLVVSSLIVSRSRGRENRIVGGDRSIGPRGCKDIENGRVLTSGLV